jgi:hypothetical protein
MPPTEPDRTPHWEPDRIARWALVIAVGAALAAFVASPCIFRYGGETKEGRARADIQTLVKACRTYRLNHDRYPESLSEVTDLLEQGQHALIDPWGNTYQYQPPSDLTSDEPPFVFTFNPKDGRRISERDRPPFRLCGWSL